MLNWDRSIQIGDLITTYYSGYFRLNRIERRYVTQGMIDQYKMYANLTAGDELAPTFYFSQVLNTEGKPRKGNKECNASYCGKVTSDWVDEKIKSYISLMETIRNHI